MLEYVREVYALFRQYIDESDKTFIKDADASRYLSMAYGEFRKIVSRFYRPLFSQSLTLTLASVDKVDLAVIPAPIMGPGAGTKRLSMLLSVSTPDPTTGRPSCYFVNTGGPSNVPSDYATGYYMEGTRLHFTDTISGDIRIDFIPVSAVDWTKTAATEDQWIDELVAYHDIIALLACSKYAIRDSASSEHVQRELNNRLNDLYEYLADREVQYKRSMISVADPIGWSY